MLLNKRYKNVRSNVFYAAIEKMVKKHIYAHIKFNSNTNNRLFPALQSSDQPNWRSVNNDLYNLVVFLFRFIGLKSKDNKKYEDEVEAKGEQIQSWLYRYSHPKFVKIWSIDFYLY